MRKLFSFAGALAALAAVPAAAQLGGPSNPTAFSVEPYAAYGFYGTLPDGGPHLDTDVAYGVKGALRLSPQFALIGTWQQSWPRVDGGRRAGVQHWSAGAQFDYHPREGAVGIPPLTLEAGVGQVRYDFPDPLTFGRFRESDTAVNLGIGSAIRLAPGFSITYGANDYLSNWEGDRGVTNQVFARVGAQLNF
jgi:hypothetical protein